MPNIIQREDLDAAGRLGHIHDGKPLSMESVLHAYDYKFVESQSVGDRAGFTPLDHNWLHHAQLLVVPAAPFREVSPEDGSRADLFGTWMEVYFLEDSGDHAVIYPNEAGGDDQWIMLYGRDPRAATDGPLKVVCAVLQEVSPGYMECRGFLRKILHCDQNELGHCVPRHQGYRCFPRRIVDGNSSYTKCKCTCGQE